MSNFLLSVVLSTATACAVAAPQSIDVVAPPTRAPSLGEIAAVHGSYELSDGRTLQISRRGRSVVAELEGFPTTPLQATSATQLRSPDGQMSLQFHAAQNGNVYGVTVALRGAAAPNSSSALVLSSLKLSAE